MALNVEPEKMRIAKLMVLAEMERQEMSKRLGLNEAIVACWESVYFDARGQGAAICWLNRHVIDPAFRGEDPFFASQLRFASFIGIVAVRAMLDGAEGVSLDEADRLFQRNLKLSQKLDAVAEMTIGSEKAGMRFATFQVKLMIAKEKLKLAREKLQQKTVEVHQRHELRKLRLELAIERSKERQREKTRRTAERRRSSNAEKTIRTAGDWIDMLASPAWTATTDTLAQLRWRTDGGDKSDDLGPTILPIISGESPTTDGIDRANSDPQAPNYSSAEAG